MKEKDSRKNNIVLGFHLFYVTLPVSRKKEFLDKLSSLCSTYTVDDDWDLRYEEEEDNE